MKDYQDINIVSSDGEENDWLEVSYTQRKYVEEPAEKLAPRRRAGVKSILKYTAMALVTVLALAGLLVVDSNFEGNVFETARATFASGLSSVLEASDRPDGTIEIPYTMTVDNVENGVVYLSGGRAVVSFTDGTVTEVGETSVTVSVDDETTIVYNNLTDVFVEAGQQLSKNDLVAKYTDSATISIMHNGEIVTDVVGSDNSVQWSV